MRYGKPAYLATGPKSIEVFGAASGVRTHDIRCHRAAFCH